MACGGKAAGKPSFAVPAGAGRGSTGPARPRRRCIAGAVASGESEPTQPAVPRHQFHASLDDRLRRHRRARVYLAADIAAPTFSLATASWWWVGAVIATSRCGTRGRHRHGAAVGFHRVVDQQRGGTVYVGAGAAEPMRGAQRCRHAHVPGAGSGGDFPASDAWRGSLHRARHRAGSRIWADAGTGGEDFAFFRAPTETLFVTMGPGRRGGGRAPFSSGWHVPDRAVLAARWGRRPPPPRRPSASTTDAGWGFRGLAVQERADITSPAAARSSRLDREAFEALRRGLPISWEATSRSLTRASGIVTPRSSWALALIIIEVTNMRDGCFPWPLAIPFPHGPPLVMEFHSIVFTSISSVRIDSWTSRLGYADRL